MLFPTVSFALFFMVVLAVNWALVRRPALWAWFLLASSWVFYGWWDWRFLGLLAASTAVNHWGGIRLYRTRGPRARRAWITGLIVFNLGLLGFFKYYGFFVQNAYLLASRLQIPCSLPLLDVILPIGLSFFTFHALSYVIDIYRGEMAPAKQMVGFGAYLAYFPHLVAGPIVRAGDILPQIENPPARLMPIDLGRATCLILVGLFKKVVIANSLSARMADPVFATGAVHNAPDTILGIYAYAVQIYCDFSAYSDIAIGLALLMGLRFPINFDAPYFSLSLQDFWRRWHISLSSWLRDYLYVPLGGSRCANWKVYRNLIVTFLVGGLWHGAAWTFVLWGALHGVYLALERLLQPVVRKAAAFAGVQFGSAAGGSARNRWPTWIAHGLARVWLFQVVCLSWIFFRSQTWGDATGLLKSLNQWHGAASLWTGINLSVLALGFLAQFLDGKRIAGVWDALARLPPALIGLIAAALLTAILAFGPEGVAPFIYFQF